MKVGLIICDHIKEEYSKDFGDYPVLFKKLFPKYDFKLYYAIDGLFPKDITEVEAYMVTGSRHAVYDDLDWIVQLKQITKEIYEAGIPLIGFCFGHQLIAESLGGKVANHDNGWCIGLHDFQVSQEQHWMLPARNKIKVLMMCQDQVAVLPKGAISLAGNEFCKHAVIQTGDHFLGVQGHPEFPMELNRQMVLDRKERFKPDNYNRAIESLQHEPDTELSRVWIEAFLKSQKSPVINR